MWRGVVGLSETRQDSFSKEPEASAALEEQISTEILFMDY
jgi:hypothetical protein